MFKPCPPLQHQPLPFTVSEIEFIKWLKRVDSSEPKVDFGQLLQILHTLNHTDMAAKIRLLFLERLGLLLFQQSEQVSKSAFTKQVPQAADDFNSIARVVWCCAELAQGYLLLGNGEEFKKDSIFSLQQKSLIIAHGLQAMSKALLFMSQCYSAPYPHFWRSCFELYQLAQQHQLKEEGHPSADLIDIAFKQLLVFSLSNTNQFSRQDMLVIYDLLGQYADHAKLLTNPPPSVIPSISLEHDSAPAKRGHDPQHSKHLIYIATTSVAAKLLEVVPAKTQRQYANYRQMLLRVAKTLTMTQNRKYPRERAQGNFFGMMGLDNIISFLTNRTSRPSHQSAINKESIMSKSGQLSDLNYTIIKHDDDEEQLAHFKRSGHKTFKLIEFTDPAEIWKTNEPDLFETNTSVIDKSKTGYSLVTTNNQLQPKVGQLIGLYRNSLSLGLIRWLAQTEEDTTLMGIELLGGKLQAVRISNPGFPDLEADAIYLPADETLGQAESMILLSDAFNPAEFIFMHKERRNIRFRLIKNLHSTELIKHIEIIRA